MGKINLTCIECPVGCEITVTVTDGNMEVSGNACPRGKLYATNEVTCPKRVVTSTVRCDNGEVVSVKTSAPVLKSEMFEVMKKINRTPVFLTPDSKSLIRILLERVDRG